MLVFKLQYIGSPRPLTSVYSPLEPKGGGGGNTRLRVRGEPIRTTEEKAWHSVYSVLHTKEKEQKRRSHL